jgi:hypothetical protein
MEEYQKGLGGSFLIILDLQLVMAPKLVYGVTCGAKPSRQPIRNCSVWPVVDASMADLFGVLQ